MITIQYGLHRKPGMSHEDFVAYWRDHHAELVRSVAGCLGIVRYVQNHGALPDVTAHMREGRGTAEPFDGLAAISFASEEELKRTDPEAVEARRRLAEDEAEFIDFSRSVILLTTAHEVIA